MNYKHFLLDNSSNLCSFPLSLAEVLEYALYSRMVQRHGQSLYPEFGALPFWLTFFLKFLLLNFPGSVVSLTSILWFFRPGRLFSFSILGKLCRINFSLPSVWNLWCCETHTLLNLLFIFFVHSLVTSLSSFCLFIYSFFLDFVVVTCDGWSW